MSLLMSVCDVTTDFESIGDKSLATLVVPDAYTAAQESAPIPKAAIPCRRLPPLAFFLFISDTERRCLLLRPRRRSSLNILIKEQATEDHV